MNIGPAEIALLLSLLALLGPIGVREILTKIIVHLFTKPSKKDPPSED